MQSPVVQAELNDRNGRKNCILIIDDQEAFARTLGESFSRAGWDVWVDDHYRTGLALAGDIRPDMVVTELRVAGTWIFDVRRSLSELKCQVVVATAYPSVATAIRVVREDIGIYLPKPVTAETVLGIVSDKRSWRCDDFEEAAWPSLDRIIWEYINTIFVAAGSMSEAARRLRIDRRSLRRMLAKYPPAR